jgi:hypothetical protein
MPKFRDKHTFLYINRNLDPTERYRVNFDDIINWVHVEDAATQRYKEKMARDGKFGNPSADKTMRETCKKHGEDRSDEVSSKNKKRKL